MSEALRQFVVEGFPATRRGCPVNYAAEDGTPYLIDREAVGGPWRFAANVQPLRAGSYIFCAVADEADDEGLYPESDRASACPCGVAAVRG